MQLLGFREGEVADEDGDEEALLIASPATHTGSAETLFNSLKEEQTIKLQTSPELTAEQISSCTARSDQPHHPSKPPAIPSSTYSD